MTYLPANAGDAGDTSSVPGLGRLPGVGNGNPLQYSCLENSMDREAWQATVHGITKSETQMSDWAQMHSLECSTSREWLLSLCVYVSPSGWFQLYLNPLSCCCSDQAVFFLITGWLSRGQGRVCWDCFIQVSLSNSEGTREGRTELSGIVSGGPTVWSLQIPLCRALLPLHSPETTCPQTWGTQTWIWIRIGALSD